jgi:adenosine deaminase
MICINTDDSSQFLGVNLQHEYHIAHDMMGINSEGRERIRQNVLLAAFMSDLERMTLKKQYRKEKRSNRFSIEFFRVTKLLF